MMVENKEVRKAEEEDPEMLTSVVDRSEKRVMMRGKEEKVHREHESWKEEKRRDRDREDRHRDRQYSRRDYQRDDYYSDEDDDNGWIHVSYRRRHRYEH